MSPDIFENKLLLDEILMVGAGLEPKADVQL